MRIAIVSDTHIPSRASSIPEWIVEELRTADHVIHAGDFDSPEGFERVEESVARLTAVAGNMDPGNLGLAAVETVELGGVRFVVTHGTGPPQGYEDRVGDTVAKHAAPNGMTVGISGHTHDVMDEELAGHRVLNPGSATAAAPASRSTMMVAEAVDGDVDVELLEG